MKPPVIKLTPVKSSQISQIGFDPESKTLAIQFNKSDSHYRYTGVPADLVDGFMKAESKGKFFGSNIKGKFGHKLIEAKKAKA